MDKTIIQHVASIVVSSYNWRCFLRRHYFSHICQAIFCKTICLWFLYWSLWFQIPLFYHTTIQIKRKWWKCVLESMERTEMTTPKTVPKTETKGTPSWVTAIHHFEKVWIFKCSHRERHWRGIDCRNWHMVQ